MPRDPIFIADDEELSEAALEAQRLNKEAEELARIEREAQWNLWLSEQSETVQQLAEEWKTLRGSKFTFEKRIDKRFREIFVVRCEHGHHESIQSHEHALNLLIDSHRERLEDRAETRERLVAAGMTPKEALQRCQQIGREIAKKHGRMPISQHDKLVEVEISKLTRSR